MPASKGCIPWNKGKKNTCNPPSKHKSIEDRFFNRIEFTEECWNWKGCVRNKQGYGVLKFHNKMISAHRFSYELFYKKPSAKKVLDHLCNNVSCVNPGHLNECTQLENLIRSNNFIGKYCRNKRRI